MKFFLSISTILILSFSAVAQNQLGIFIGGQTTGAKYLVFNQKQDVKMKYGVQVGANLKVPFEGNLYFSPAAFYSLKGYDVTFKDFVFPPDATALDNSTTIHTFELAPMLQYDFGTKPSHFFIKAGPSLDFQLFGKEKFNLRNGTTVSRTMKWSPGDYGRYSANLLAQFGYETSSGLMIFAQYTLGGGSINNADGGPRIRHRVYGLSIGKYLKRNKIIIDTRNKE
jgi:Outer membrane protein beta-barrel domain